MQRATTLPAATLMYVGRRVGSPNPQGIILCHNSMISCGLASDYFSASMFFPDYRDPVAFFATVASAVGAFKATRKPRLIERNVGA